MDPGGTRFGALLDAIDEERSHLGCKLHDTVVQNLAAISIHLSLLEGTCGDVQSRETTQQCARLIDESIRELRTISGYLSPVLLPELDFAACLRSLVEFAAADGITVHLNMDGVRRMNLSQPSRNGVFRLIWDAVRAIAEAGARDVQVNVTADGEHLRVRMRGEVPERVQDGGGTLPWWIVQARAGRLGGELKMDVTAGRQELEFTVPHGG